MVYSTSPLILCSLLGGEKDVRIDVGGQFPSTSQLRASFMVEQVLSSVMTDQLSTL